MNELRTVKVTKKQGAPTGWRVLYEYDREEVLPVPLTPKALTAKADMLKATWDELAAKREALAEAKREMAPLVKLRDSLMQQVATRSEPAYVPCTSYIDPDDKTVRIVRDDTGEVVREREANPWESQRDIEDEADDETDDEDEDS